jgi:hypothetical protein
MHSGLGLASHSIADAAGTDCWHLLRCWHLLLRLQESTVQGYLAEAAAAYGCSLQQAQALQAAAGLSGDAAAEVLLWRLVAAMHSNSGAPLSALKSSLPLDVTHGQIKVLIGPTL